MTTFYVVTKGTEQIKRVGNKAAAIKAADAAYDADKSQDVTVTVEKSGTVVHERIGVTVAAKPRAATGPRVEAKNLTEQPPNARGYVHSDADTHGTMATYGKGCRCITPIEHDGRTIYGCLGACHEYDRWWRAQAAAKKAGQPVPTRPTFPSAPRAAKSTAAPVKGAARAAALVEKMAAKTA